MKLQKRIARAIGAAALVLVAVPGIASQQPARPDPVKIPENATVLEGVPTVRVDAAEDKATRRQLDVAEAARNRMTIRIKDGRFYWASREDRPLTLSSNGEFTYLSSAGEPGRYVRLRQLGDRITYAEHVDMAWGSVTYWGEVRIVLGK